MLGTQAHLKALAERKESLVAESADRRRRLVAHWRELERAARPMSRALAAGQATLERPDQKSSWLRKGAQLGATLLKSFCR